MANDQRRMLLLEVLLLGGISAVLHQTGVFLLFFAVPVQLLAVKRGFASFMNAAMVSLGVIALWKGVQIMRIAVPGGDTTLIMLDLLLPAGVLGGLAMINWLGKRSQPLQEWLKFAGGILLSAMVIVPMLLYVRQSELFLAVIEGHYSFLQEQGLVDTVTFEQLFNQVLLMLMRSIGGFVAAMLLLNYYFGSGLGGDRNRLAKLQLPWWTMLIVLVGGVMMLLNMGGLPGIVAWNITTVFGVMLTFIGAAFIGSLVNKKVPPGRVRLFWIGGILLLMFVPFVNIAIVLLMPLVGVAETVVNLRERFLNNDMGKGVTNESHFER